MRALLGVKGAIPLAVRVESAKFAPSAGTVAARGTSGDDGGTAVKTGE